MAKTEKTEITQQGYDDLVAELEELKVRIPTIIDKVQKARDDGDLKENAPYHAAREELGYANGRKEEIEAILKNCVIAEGNKKNVVGLGSKIKLTNLANKQILNLIVVSENEADFMAGKLSSESPIGKAIMGQKSGATVTVKMPKGDTKYSIEIAKK